MRHEALCKLLDEHADRLTDRVLAEMYRDPFWHARFGHRADVHGRKDGRFHVDYLIQALHADDPVIVENYARWLQQVLTSRGMCTRHLADNFELLGRAISAESEWPEREAAVAMLDRARGALRYTSHPAAEVYAAIDELARAAGDSGRPVRELADYACYAADALALALPEVLANHAVFMAGLTEDGAGIARALRAMAPVVPGAQPVFDGAVEALRGSP